MKHTSEQARNKRSKVRQGAKNANYDKTVINAILDEAIVGTVSVCIDNEPFSIPMAIARIGNYIYLHGSNSSRLMKHMAQGNTICINVTLLDGVVVARSGMHCSANYRSVCIHAKGEVVPVEDKVNILDEIVEKIIPNSRGDYREHLAKEIKATMVIAVPINESAAKIRQGDAKDDKGDEQLPYWAGEIPVKQVYGEPVSNKDLKAGIEVPLYAKQYKRPVG